MTKYALFALISVLLICQRVVAAQTQELTVAVAANMQFAFKEIEALYEQETNVSIKPVYGASGKLATQIINGAPFHVYLAANMQYPQILHKEGFAGDQPRVYAYGRLVLCSNRGEVLDAVTDLTQKQFQSIAVADPKLAPYGKQTIAMLQGAGVYDALKERLVFGQSISQVNHFLLMRSVDAGFTSKSIWMTKPKMAGDCWEIPADTYQTIEQGAVVIKNYGEEQTKAARDFYVFLFSAASQSILKKYGYGVPK
jgi:molybdate transport system substrate-binding protein